MWRSRWIEQITPSAPTDKVAFSIRKNSAEQTPHEFAATDPVRELTKSHVLLRRIPSGLTLIARIKRMHPGGETEDTFTFKIDQADFER